MKKSLFIIGFCLMGYFSIGQTGSGSLYFSPHNGSGSIVRYVPSTGKHIVYSEYQTSNHESHFTLTDMVNEIDAHVADNYVIKDFEIIDNYVIFCGYFPYVPGVKTGIIGWFDIDSLFYYGVSPTIDHSLFTLGMETLDNIEVFRDPTGNMHIAGYGETTTPSIGSGTNYRALEAIGNLPGYFNYRTTDLGRYGAKSDIVDMAVTDNYVVFLGWERDASNIGLGIMLHPLPKYNMIFSNMIKSFYFELVTHTNPSLPTDYIDPISTPKIVHSTGDNVAVCSYRQDRDINSPPPFYLANIYYLSHWRFDISPFLSGLPIQMVSAATAQLPGNVNGISGFIYDNLSNNYVVLHDHELTGGYSEYAVTTMDFSSGSVPAYVVSDYQTSYPTNNYWKPNSICLDVSSRYTVSGYKYYVFEQTIWQNIINTVGGRCSNSVTYPMLSQSPLPPALIVHTATLMGWSKIVFGQKHTVNLYPYPSIRLCPNY